MLEDVLQVHDLGPVIHHREHNDSKGGFDGRVFVEQIFDHLWVFALAKGQHHAHSLAVGFIANVLDSLDSFSLNEFGDSFEKPCLVNLVGKFGYDQVLLSDSSTSTRPRILMTPLPVS